MRYPYKSLPRLEFTERDVASIVRELADDDTLIISDSYSYPLLPKHGRIMMIRNNNAEQVRKIREEYTYSRVIAVGGCTALDIGRAVAAGSEVIALPTILSNSCISVDRSVLNYNGRNRGEKTTAPARTIVSITSLLETSPKELKRWSSSGFGDVLSRISASTDFHYREGDLSLETVMGSAPRAFEAMEWVIDSFRGYDRDCLVRLATYSHEASLDVIRRGDATLSAAGEHKLDYKMREQQNRYTEKRPTHGQAVSVGTLLSAAILGERTADHSLYRKLRAAYQKLGLPTDYRGLRCIGIERQHLVEGLNGIGEEGTYLGDYFRQGNHSIIDRTFGGDVY